MEDAPLERVRLNVCPPRSDKVRKLDAHCNWGWGPNSVSQTTNNGYYFLTDDFAYTHHVDAVYEIYPNH